MNTNFTSISSRSVYFFKENILPTLTVQQKKIVIVTSIVLSFLAACYLVRHYYLKGRAVNVDTRNQDVLQPATTTPIKSYKPLNEKKILQEAEKQFANNPYKDELIKKVKHHLDVYKKIGYFLYGDINWVSFSSEVEKQKFEIASQELNSFFARRDLFNGVSINILTCTR